MPLPRLMPIWPKKDTKGTVQDILGLLEKNGLPEAFVVEKADMPRILEIVVDFARNKATPHGGKEIVDLVEGI